MSGVEWADQPTGTHFSSRGATPETVAIVRALKETPGRWAVFRDVNSSKATYIRRGNSVWTPAGAFEVENRNYQVGRGRADCWVRYVGLSSTDPRERLRKIRALHAPDGSGHCSHGCADFEDGMGMVSAKWPCQTASLAGPDAN